MAATTAKEDGMTTAEKKFEVGLMYALFTKTGRLKGLVTRRTAATVTFTMEPRSALYLGTDAVTLRVTGLRDGAEAAAGTVNGYKLGHAKYTRLEAYANSTAC